MPAGAEMQAVSQIFPLLQDGWMGNLPSLGYVQSVAGISQHEVASLCGVSSETYRRWRTDRKPPWLIMCCGQVGNTGSITTFIKKSTMTTCSTSS